MITDKEIDVKNVDPNNKNTEKRVLYEQNKNVKKCLIINVADKIN